MHVIPLSTEILIYSSVSFSVALEEASSVIGLSASTVFSSLSPQSFYPLSKRGMITIYRRRRSGLINYDVPPVPTNSKLHVYVF